MTRIAYDGKKFKELCLNGVDWYEHVRGNGQVVLVSVSEEHPSLTNKYYCEL